MTSSVLGNDIQTGQRVELFKPSRLLGLYIIGLQGMGKSGLFEELILQDIKQDIGVCVLDPHGELVDNIIARLPDTKKEEKVIYLDLLNYEYPFGLNLFACADLYNELSVDQTRSQFLHIFEKAFGITSANPTMYTLLSNCAYTLIANPGYTMTDIRRLLTNKVCRERLLQNVHKTDVLDYWHSHYDRLSPQKQDEESFYILNKLNDFENAPLRYIVGQSRTTIDLQAIMDEGKILLVKLSRRLEEATKLVGSILVALILNAADMRQRQQTRKQFHLYADEFQNFATEDFAVLLEEARKSGIGITMAHQNRSQLELSDKQADKNLKARTLSVGNLVVFRVPTDAQVLAPQFKADPKPGETEYKQLYEPWGDKVKKKVWQPPEAEAEYKKVSEELSRVRYLRGELAKFTQYDLLMLFSLSMEDFIKLAEANVPATDERLIDSFYSQFNPFNDLHGLHASVQEVFPSEAVKNTTRPIPYPGEKFFVTTDTSFISEAESNLKWAIEIGGDAAVDGEHFDQEILKGVSAYLASGGKNNQKLLPMTTLTSLSQQLPVYDLRSYPLYLRKSIQDILRPYRQNAIYHFIPDIEHELYDNMREIEERIAKRDLKKIEKIYAMEWPKHNPHEYNSFGHLKRTPSSFFREVTYEYVQKQPEYIEAVKKRESEIKQHSQIDAKRYVKTDVYGGFVGYWRIHTYPRLWEWFKVELRKQHAILSQVSDYIEQRYTYLASEYERLRLCEIEVEEFVPKTYETATGEHHTGLYVKSEEVKAKITHSFSETRQLGDKFPTSFGHSVSVSEERISLSQQQPGENEPIANAWNRTVDELTHLPQYTARVKLSAANGSIVEHTIQTIAPAKGLYGAARRERIERIQTHNRDPKKGYCRPLQDVEAEITQRQTQCTQRALPLTQPQQPPPQIARKAASPCPSCGFSNPSGSKFCNQCGAKL